MLTVTDDLGATDTAFADAVLSEGDVNAPPDCSAPEPSSESIWPPNHKFVHIDIQGVTDIDGDAVSVVVDSIFQDEPVNSTGDGNTARDGKGVGTAFAEVRAERSGSKHVPGNGRVYHIGFTASDGRGGSCNGTVLVGVPHNVKDTAYNDGAIYDSTLP
jgi:hypothetical protein